jgi:hypothetical protein
MQFPKLDLSVPYEKKGDLGFFQVLERFHKLNLNNIGLVHIKSTNPAPGSLDRSSIVSVVGRGNFMSLNIPNSTVQIDLRKWVLQPTHYLIEVDRISRVQMLCWVLEGSIDGIHWMCLDDRRFPSPAIQHLEVFRCHSDIPLRLLRLTQTAPNTYQQWSLSLRRLDFFGNAHQVPEAPVSLPTELFI